jgi:hypothetical protein
MTIDTVFLKVKITSLAAEQKIIRRQEQKAKKRYRSIGTQQVGEEKFVDPKYGFY